MSYDMSFVGELRFADHKTLKRAFKEVSSEGCFEEAAFRKRDLRIGETTVAVELEVSAPASAWDISCFLFELLAGHATAGRIEARYDPGEGPDLVLVEVIEPSTREQAAPTDPQEALDAAAQAGDLERVRAGLAPGIDLDRVLRSGLKHVAIVQALLAAGASADGTPSSRPLRWAAQFGYHKSVQALVRAGADPNAAEHGTTPLEMACAHGHRRVVRALLDLGARPDGGGTAPIVAAATAVGSKHGEVIVEMLLEAGAAPNPRAYRDRSLVDHLQMYGGKPEEKRILARLREVMALRG